MSPDFFARHLLELGFDEVVASRFPALPFAEPLDPANILTPGNKVRIVAEMCGRYGLSRSQYVSSTGIQCPASRYFASSA